MPSLGFTEALVDAVPENPNLSPKSSQDDSPVVEGKRDDFRLVPFEESPEFRLESQPNPSQGEQPEAPNGGFGFSLIR